VKAGELVILATKEETLANLKSVRHTYTTITVVRVAMLDPFTTLSLVGNLIQFIDFSSKLVTKGREIYRSADGALRENLEVEVVTADFSKVV
jgi:hypothetical protein